MVNWTGVLLGASLAIGSSIAEKRWSRYRALVAIFPRWPRTMFFIASSIVLAVTSYGKSLGWFGFAVFMLGLLVGELVYRDPKSFAVEAR